MSIKISILYPNKPGARFDMRYYVETHMPRSIEPIQINEVLIAR